VAGLLGGLVGLGPIAVIVFNIVVAVLENKKSVTLGDQLYEVLVARLLLRNDIDSDYAVLSGDGVEAFRIGQQALGDER
jgi:hypothetical protein